MQDNSICFDYHISPENFNLTFRPITRSVESWDKELTKTALRIANSTNKPLILGLSGGIDSEVIARVFLESKIPFTVLTIHHEGNTNNHDISYARSFCDRYKIKQNIVNIDMIKFLKSGYQQYAGLLKYKTPIVAVRYMQSLVLDEIEKMGGCGILGGTELDFKVCFENKIGLSYKSDMVSIHEYIKNKNQLHYPWFYLNNSELVASYIQEDIMVAMFKDYRYYLSFKESVDNDGNAYEKILIYHRYFPDMVRRRKFTGFERLRIAFDDISAKHNMLPAPLTAYISVEELKQQLGIITN